MLLRNNILFIIKTQIIFLSISKIKYYAYFQYKIDNGDAPAFNINLFTLITAEMNILKFEMN